MALTLFLSVCLSVFKFANPGFNLAIGSIVGHSPFVGVLAVACGHGNIIVWSVAQ